MVSIFTPQKRWLLFTVLALFLLAGFVTLLLLTHGTIAHTVFISRHVPTTFLNHRGPIADGPGFISRH